jgi:hypothetical protein
VVDSVVATPTLTATPRPGPTPGAGQGRRAVDAWRGVDVRVVGLQRLAPEGEQWADCDWTMHLLGCGPAPHGAASVRTARSMDRIASLRPEIPCMRRTGAEGGASLHTRRTCRCGSEAQTNTGRMRGGRMISGNAPGGSAPDAPRERRTRRNRQAATITGPPTTSRLVPSVAPEETSEPAPTHCAVFWRQGPGSGS